MLSRPLPALILFKLSFQPSSVLLNKLPTPDTILGTASFFATGAGVYTIYGGGNVAVINITETISAEFFDTETITVFEGLDVFLRVKT